MKTKEIKMSVRNMIAVLVPITAAVVLFGCKAKTKADEPIAVAEEQVKSPSDSSVADEIWYFFNGDVQKNLQLARNTFTSKDYDSMIYGIEKAAAIMKLEAQRASGQNKIDLDNSIKKMENLANDVRAKVFVPVPEYEQAFGNAQYVLGKFHLDKAKEMWKRKDYFTTGEELNEASLNLENAHLWIGHEVDSTSMKALDQSQKVAMDLMKDVKWVPDNVVNAFESLSTEVGKLKGQIVT